MTDKASIAINSEACTGCRTCEVVCSLFHEQQCSPSEARIKVSADLQQGRFEPLLCHLCDSPDCVQACPTGALEQNSQTGVVNVDNTVCNRCQACVEACPHHSIRWNNELDRIFLCDRCSGAPTCVKFCTSGALQLA